MAFSKLCALTALMALILAQKPLSVLGQPPDFPALQAELDANRALWQTQSTPEYEMTISVNCFCVPEARGTFDLVVKNNAIVSAEPDNQFSQNLPTIEGLFTIIQNAINSNVAALTVSYDTTLGFPTNLFIDQDFRIADEEIGYEVSGVQLKKTSPVPDRKCRTRDISRMISFSDVLSVPTDGGFRPGRFIAAFNRWAIYAGSVGCSYRYELRRSCFCLRSFVGPFTITVENGVVVAATFEGGTPVPAAEREDLPTITGLFKNILEEAENADSVDIDFDLRTGVPTKASIDRIALAVDDEITFLAKLL